jgi:hypothetical protein
MFVLNPRIRARLTREPLDDDRIGTPPRKQELERNHSTELEMDRAHDDPHAALAEYFFDPVRSVDDGTGPQFPVLADDAD